ncbi:MAG: HAD hydrolase-like protein [Verrucomicrobiales bacterium]|nr:HAD hydrolase-like protein [Verrucomicrobiales bacterium]
MSTERRRLLLFDIDGTLLHTGGAGISSIYEGLQQAFNLQNQADQMPALNLAGATDAGLVIFLFKHFEIEHTASNEEAFYHAYHQSLERNLAQHAQEHGGHLLLGITALLERLHGHEQISLGLLTGNIRRGAWTKLEQFEIRHFFDTGAFGDDHHDRNQLGPIAIDRARLHFDHDFAPADTVIIGDTPKDIACARACGACAIAVATGTFSHHELAAFQPDHLFENFSDEHSLLRALKI